MCCSDFEVRQVKAILQCSTFAVQVLIADFFFILFILAWFVAGIGAQTLGKSTGLLDAWYSLWQVVFQPALGVLMLGALASGLLGKKGDDK